VIVPLQRERIYFYGVCHASSKTPFYYPLTHEFCTKKKSCLFQQDTALEQISHKNKNGKLQEEKIKQLNIA